MKKVLTKIMGMIFTFFILFRSSCFADLIDDFHRDIPREKIPEPPVKFDFLPIIIVGIVVVAIIIAAIVIIVVTTSKKNETTQSVETFGNIGNIDNNANNENKDNKEIK